MCTAMTTSISTPDSIPLPSVKALTPAMRWMLWTAGFLVFAAGAQLFLFAEHTASFFAWTIDPPLTAATLGALYWGAMLLEVWAARAANWAQARAAVPGVLVFTAVMNIPIFENLSSMHLDRAITWVWVAVYLIVPLVMGGLLVHQLKQPGEEPRTRAPLPLAMRGTLGLHALFFLVYGVALMMEPEAAGAYWPWELSPNKSVYVGFNEPYLGCWLLGLGVVATQVCWENDLARLEGAFFSYFMIAVLLTLALLRFPDPVVWSSPSAFVMVILLTSIAAVGLAGTWLARARD